MGAVAVDLENFDGAIGGAGSETTTVEVELGVVNHICMGGVDEGFRRDLREKTMVRLREFVIVSGSGVSCC